VVGAGSSCASTTRSDGEGARKASGSVSDLGRAEGATDPVTAGAGAGGAGLAVAGPRGAMPMSVPRRGRPGRSDGVAADDDTCVATTAVGRAVRGPGAADTGRGGCEGPVRTATPPGGVFLWASQAGLKLREACSASSGLTPRPPGLPEPFCPAMRVSASDGSVSGAASFGAGILSPARRGGQRRVRNLRRRGPSRMFRER
jgi:hypothetical protein